MRCDLVLYLPRRHVSVSARTQQASKKGKKAGGGVEGGINGAEMEILSSTAGDGALATLFVEEEKGGRKIPVETRSVRIASQKQLVLLLLRPRSTRSKTEKKKAKKL